MDVTVQGSPARPLAYGMFTDLTTANVTQFLASDDSCVISFDADVTAVQSQIIARVLTADANAETIHARAYNAIAANDTFLAITSPTNAQAIAQVQKLTRENTAIIRLLLGLLDSTAGT